MISPRVPSKSEIEGCLRDLDFSETAHRSNTGCFWKHGASGHHLLVPDSVQGFYPEWIFDTILMQAEDIAGTRVKQWPGWLPRPNNSES